jgi:tetratricopeptide (TPR) repeat protein
LRFYPRNKLGSSFAAGLKVKYMNATDNIIEVEKLEYPKKKGSRPSTPNTDFPIFRSCFLVFFTLTLVLGLGCSRAPVKKSPEAVEKKTCDLRADTAMQLEAYDTSIKLHHSFIEKEPENELALYHLGLSYGHTGNYQKEIYYYEKAIAIGFKEDQIFFNLGMALGEVNQLEKAIDAFKKGLTMNPDSADNHFGLGLTYQTLGMNQDAERAFKKAIKINQEDLDARFYLSLLYVDMGHFLEARQQLLRILEIDPSYMSARDLLDNLMTH